MNKANLDIKLRSCRLQKRFFFLVSLFIATIVSFKLLTTICLAGLPTTAETDKSLLRLQVDNEKVRAFYKNVLILPRIFDSLELYSQDVTGKSKTLFKTALTGGFDDNNSGVYTLTGNNKSSGTEYQITVQQPELDLIELSMTFKTDSPKSNLRFNVIKVSGDFFRGAQIGAIPITANDAGIIPDTPLPFEERMLLENKSSVKLKGPFCDLEITDSMGDKTLQAADFRMVPWDRYRSIYFGVAKYGLTPGKEYSFKYTIRSRPGSLVIDSDKYARKESIIEDFQDWKFYSIPPKYEEKESGTYRLDSSDIIFGNGNGTAENLLATEILNYTSLQLPIKQYDRKNKGRGIIIKRMPEKNYWSIPNEGFLLITSTKNIIIRGVGERGCLYGVYALLGRLEYNSDNWEMNCGRIQDWPDLPVRGLCMDLQSPAIRNVNIVKRYLYAFSKARSNLVIFYHSPTNVKAWLNKRDDGGWTKEQVLEIAQYAESLHMEVWGGMKSKFNSNDFPQLLIEKNSKHYNPFEETSYQYLFSLYDEIIDAYQPSTMLIGHDEIKGLSIYADQSGVDPADIFAMDVDRIHKRFKLQNIKTAIWGDMLLDHDVWEETVGSANSNNNAFNSGATHLALSKLPEDLVILDWHYNEKNDYASIDYFSQNGFNVIGSTWFTPNAAQAFARDVKKYNGNGIISTDWGFSRTFSPAATTLYAPICGWSEKYEIDQNDDDLRALAETFTNPDRPFNSANQKTIDLSAAANDLTDKLFDLGPALNLSGFQSGTSKFRDIMFDILPDERGQAAKCVSVSNKEDKVSTGKIILKRAQTSNSIAFLHTCYLEEPQYRLRNIGYYIVEYENGQKEKIDLLENWNITDIRSTDGLRYNSWRFIRSPDVLIGSRLAWRGFSSIGIPLNLQLHIWKNPFPDLKILKISLAVKTKPVNSSIALLAMTLLQ